MRLYINFRTRLSLFRKKRMIETCRKCLPHFNSHWVREELGTFSITETNPLGAGSATFQAENAIVIKADMSAPLLWSLAQRKCADGAFITFDEAGMHLHIVELKGKITPKTWAHVLMQFEGMYLTSLAVSRLLQISDLQSVTCYVAATEDAVSNPVEESASPTLLKGPVGKPKTFGGLEQWLQSSISLPFAAQAVLVKGWKDNTGSVDFGAV